MRTLYEQRKRYVFDTLSGRCNLAVTDRDLALE